MSPPARMAAGNAPPEAGVSTSDDAGAGPFVINLTSSTTPMALAHPDSPELKRFSFFVSRRREDNRERFRLHMGYFATLAEAEEWLNVIRDLYPGAWAGEAPGKKLRARAAAADLANQLPAPPPAASARTQAPAPAAKAAAARRTPAAEINVPTLQAAPTLPPAPQAAVPASAAPMLEAVAQAAAALAAVAKTAMAQSAPQVTTSFEAPPPAVDHTVLAPSPFVPARVTQAAPVQPVFTPAPPAPVAAPQPPRVPARLAAAAAVPVPPAASKPIATQAKGAKRNAANPLTDGSNVREVMAALDETGETRRMQIPAGLRAPVAPAPKASIPAAANASLAAASTAAAARRAGEGAGRASIAPAQNAAPNAASNVVQPRAQNAAPNARSFAAPAGERPRAAPPPRAPVVESAPPDLISDTQVLRMLETRRTEENEKGSDDANVGISLLKPDDTQTRRALKEAVLDNAPVSFAVQLQWSVQPVQLDKVPPLAIFSAYTLYTVEGSREGRKWYGLRLGFFSDAISAKQVAYYVRSEFTSVAVVPVSPAEKARANDEENKAATGAFQRKHVAQKMEEFKLFDDEKAAAAEAPAPARAAETKPAATPAARAPTRKNKPLGRVKAKEQRSPKTLEETLEILGASELEIDNGRGEVLNDTGVRHLRVEVQKETPFAKLLDRISERVRRN